MSAETDYWKECIALGAEDCDLELTDEQLECLAESAKGGHEHYGMAFYDPGWSGRMNDIEKEYKDKLKSLQADFEKYQRNAETAIKQALRQYEDASVSIGEFGEVFRHNGRTVQIQ